MEMDAIVISIDPRGLLVRDSATGNEVFVNFGNPRLFSPGDAIRITFNGIMTNSLPPQISASSIARIPQAQPAPTFSEIRRARILQVRRGILLVRDPSSSRQVIVEYPYAHHFCAGQLVNVQFETVFLDNQLRVIATDVIPIC